MSAKADKQLNAVIKFLTKRDSRIIYNPAIFFSLCAEHGTNLASESLATGIYRQV